MFMTALALVLLTAIALIAGLHNYPQSSVIEILGVNLFFITPYVISGLLFRYLIEKTRRVSETEP
jgi:hypothetical protein